MKELPKTYSPEEHEDLIYQMWEESGFFNPDVCVEKGVTEEDAQPFSITLPPPNATGTLHIGHSVMLAVEDLLIRYHRMRGERTLWLPGTDHAALATQEKVERILWDTEQKTRHDLGRESFLKRVDEFVDESRNTMRRQMRKMGSSLDWSREAFTLDADRNLAVRTAFKKMFDEGIIYRGDRIVNWDPKMQTTVSDDEIEWKEETVPFYYFQYGPFVIGTSRPETKFGDKYVVVHPDDERYAKYHDGQKFEAEWINGTITAILIKDPIIDMSFGSGAMTITPWHDPTDFDIAERHHLDKEQIIDYDGHLLNIAGSAFKGLTILEARRKIVEKLREKGLLVKTEDNYIHNVAINSRGGGTIEPQIKRQWFINVNKEFDRDGTQTSLKKLMQEAVREKGIEFVPKRFEKTYFHWIDNLRDWCISRQIWYGHQIPVYYCQNSKQQTTGDTPCQKPIVSIEGLHKCPHCGGKIEQDPDTLDTWFSAGLWTFSTLGWPDQTINLKTFHPTSVMETGYDILFFWVARMILMSTYLLDEVPFKTVYLHGLVRDEQGRKMSKSLGNVLDPLDIIPKYGTDAIRLSLLIGSTPGNDVRLGEEKIASYRNFTNKLWNIARFALQNKSQITNDTFQITSDSGRWILSQMALLIDEVTHDLDKYQFSQAGEKLRDFTWNTFADWYLEISKFEENKKETNNILMFVLEDLLKLWHPFMPFVTETIWQEITNSTEKTPRMLMIEKWPALKKYQDVLSASDKDTADFSTILQIVQAIRNLRSANRIEPKNKLPAILTISKESKSLLGSLEKNKHLILKLRTNLSELEIQTTEKIPENCLSQAVTANISVFIPRGSTIDIEQEHERLVKEETNIKKLIQSTTDLLSNPGYRNNAPAHIVQKTEKLLIGYQKKLTEVQKHLHSIV